MEDVDILYGHLVCFTDIWYILCTFCILCGNLEVFFSVLLCCNYKSGNPGLEVCNTNPGVDKSSSDNGLLLAVEEEASVRKLEFFPTIIFPTELEPVLRFLNLQLQRQRCSRLERF
jgi:hypothetical protein